MTDFTLTTIEVGEPDYDYPSYSAPGDLVAYLYPAEPYPNGRPSVYTYTVEETDYTPDSCLFWVAEEEGFQHWVDSHAPSELPEGVYVFEDVTGTYHRGDGWHTDDDVDWEFSALRRATPEEAVALFGCDLWQTIDEEFDT